MKRYKIVTVDLSNTDAKWVVPGTYTLETARKLVTAYRKLGDKRVAFIEEIEQRRRRRACFLELTFDSGLVRRQWICEYLPEKAIQQVIRRSDGRLSSVRLWWCRDDCRLGDPPLLDYRRLGGVFRKVA